MKVLSKLFFIIAPMFFYSCLSEKKLEKITLNENSYELQFTNSHELGDRAEISEILIDNKTSESMFLMKLENSDSQYVVEGLSHEKFYKDLKGRTLRVNSFSYKKSNVDSKSVELSSMKYSVEKSDLKAMGENSKSRKLVTIIINTTDFDNTGVDGENSVERVSEQLKETKTYYEDITDKSLELDGVIQDGKPDVFVIDLDIKSKDFCEKNPLLKQLKISNKATKEIERKYGTFFLKLYDHKIFVMPSARHMKCDYSGAGTIGATKISGTKIWLLASYLRSPLIIHELGHNFELRHSGANGETYGDHACHMGSGRSEPLLFNPVKLARLDSLKDKHVSEIKKDNRGLHRDQVIKIYPYNLENFQSGKKIVIKVKKGLSGIKKDLYLNYLNREDFQKSYRKRKQWNEIANYSERSVLRVTEDLKSNDLWSSLIGNSFRWNAVWSNAFGNHIEGKDQPLMYKNENELQSRIALKLLNNHSDGSVEVLVDFVPFRHKDIINTNPNCSSLFSQCTEARSNFMANIGKVQENHYRQLILELDEKLIRECNGTRRCLVMEP